jgi:copper resistance protein C
MKFGNFGIHAAAAAVALLTAAPALAHAKLVGSNPAANAAVAAPRTISLTFSDKVVPAFSSFEVVMDGHDMKVPVNTVVSKDGKTITGTVRGGMMAGTYKIVWRIAASDGHRMTGEVPFRVR